MAASAVVGWFVDLRSAAQAASASSIWFQEGPGRVVDPSPLTGHRQRDIGHARQGRFAL
jgi:hypothetical protein